MAVDAAARQPADRAAPGRQRRPVDDACPGRERPLRTRGGLLPRLPGDRSSRAASTSTTTTASTPALSAGRVRARRPAARPSRPDRRPVLALLVLQRLEQQARGRLGVRAGPASRLHGRRGAHRRADRRRLRPARGRRARRLDSEKLEREGTHPVVYSSQRSHASYFGQALYMGRSASEGFGCDNTDGPSTRVDPEVVVSRTASTIRRPARLARLRGTLGRAPRQRQQRPDRTVRQARWTEPVDWHDGLRDSSFVVPTGDSRATRADRRLLRGRRMGLGEVHRLRRLPGAGPDQLALLVALVVFLVRRTSWRSVGPVPPAHRRRAGEIVRVAVVHYRRHPGTFTAVGAIAVPVAGVALLAGAVIKRLPFIGDLVTVSDTEGTGGRLSSRRESPDSSAFSR